MAHLAYFHQNLDPPPPPPSLPLITPSSSFLNSKHPCLCHNCTREGGGPDSHTHTPPLSLNASLWMTNGRLLWVDKTGSVSYTVVACDTVILWYMYSRCTSPTLMLNVAIHLLYCTVCSFPSAIREGGIFVPRLVFIQQSPSGWWGRQRGK